ncbi:MAG: molybdenum cofactor guanylyltransferase MobA [Candidatus Sedimenticola sp. (ex Thyasira tokunagai)]
MGYDSSAITGVILAGGLARRMGGHDKGLVELAGKPMIEYVVESMALQVGNLLINANRSETSYQYYGFPVIHDSRSDFAGPLAGIAAAMEQSSSEILLAVPCDGPWLPLDLGERLYRKMLESKADVCVAHDGDRLQPVFGLFRCSLAPSIIDFLESGDRKIKLWLEQQRSVVADFSDCPEAFINVNTPEERDRVEQQLIKETTQVVSRP